MSAQMKQVSVTTMDGIAVVQIDNPPVNALSRGVPEALPAVVARLADDAAIAPSSSWARAARSSPAPTSTSWNRPRGATGAALPDLHDLLRRDRGRAPSRS